MPRLFRYFAFDHVATTAAVEVKGQPAIRSVYLARGRPDKWQPWTKADHRRIPKPGVWVCSAPQNDSNEEYWRSRRKVRGPARSARLPSGGHSTAI